MSDLVKLKDLAVPFAKHLCEHLETAPVQTTSPSSKFLDACRKFNAGELSQDALRETTVKLGFNNVVTASMMSDPIVKTDGDDVGVGVRCQQGDRSM